MPILETRNLSVDFGGVRAVDGLSMEFPPGAVVGLIGPNGAGKTTFVDAVTGFVPSTGNVFFDGNDISRAPAHLRSRLGLARTWQAAELFDDLTVQENLEVATNRPTLRSFASSLLRRERPGAKAEVDEALEILGIGDLGAKGPLELSQGQRKLVGLARALAARPKLVCMDEPAAGLDTRESRELGDRLRALQSGGTSILLIDHDMGLVLTVCDVIYVVEFGRLIASGSPSEVRCNERVIQAYLGPTAVREAAIPPGRSLR